MQYGSPFWKQIPLLRILVSFIAGIITRYYVQLSASWLAGVCITGILCVLLMPALRSVTLYRLRWIGGAALLPVFFCAGCWWQQAKDLRNSRDWIGANYRNGDRLLLTIIDGPVEKPKSYKCLAAVEAILHNDSVLPARGNILLYFTKEKTPPDLSYGTRLLIDKDLQPITSSGNPGAFNYSEYAAFNETYYDCFLQQSNYKVVEGKGGDRLHRSLAQIRQHVLDALRHYITDQRTAAVAEALLIGYREDLGRDLVQTYSNTGVVHIIAISGLHLGMIYALLVWMMSPFKRKSGYRFAKPIIIITVLWLFTLLAGAVPSIARSAVMFTCILTGELMGRRTTIYNTLAASAFLLVCYNPFYLWDVGFQLSFAAVLSIVALSKPIQNWLYIENKILRGIWELSAVTLAAQLLTLPIILYNFHQFPNFFLFTNLIVVPLSGVILFAEIILLTATVLPAAATIIGKITGSMVWLMNTVIERTSWVPWSVTNNIKFTLVQTLLLYLFVICTTVWLFHRRKTLLLFAVASFVAIIAIYSIDVVRTGSQHKLVVYNVPKQTAIDVIRGHRHVFIGDSIVNSDPFLRSFHLQPCRLMFRAPGTDTAMYQYSNRIIAGDSLSLLIISESNTPVNDTLVGPAAILLSHNPGVHIAELQQRFTPTLIIADASNSRRKIDLWKKECDSLHLRFHNVPEQGAFLMDL